MTATDQTVKYSYNCVDRSLLLPYFKTYYVTLYFRLIPRSLTANLITLFSSSLNLIMLLALFAGPDSRFFAIVAAFCIHGYAVGDHLDGMQAKETNTGSPLGEFLDHYLDVYNGSIILFVVLELFGNIPAEPFYLLFWLNFLAFGATMTEELETGTLTFGRIGTLEALVLLFFFLVLWTVPQIRELWSSEMAAGYQWYWLLLVSIGAGYLLTTLDIFSRMRYVPGHFLLFAAVTLALAYGLYRFEISRTNAWIVQTLTAGEYIAKVMESHLLRKKARLPDPFVSLLVFFSLGAVLLGPIPRPLASIAAGMLSIYLVARVLWISVRVAIALKRHWRWKNPSLGV